MILKGPWLRAWGWGAGVSGPSPLTSHSMPGPQRGARLLLMLANQSPLARQEVIHTIVLVSCNKQHEQRGWKQ